MVGWLQAHRTGLAGIVINPAGFSYEAYPVLDALKLADCQDRGSEAGTIAGQPFEPVAVGSFVVLVGDQRRAQRAGICQRHSRCKPKARAKRGVGGRAQRSRS